MRAIVLAGAVALALTSARGAAASPEDIFGYGARTMAMGATGVAHATGYEAAYANPALASVMPRSPADAILTLGYVAATFRLDASGAPPAGPTSNEPAKGTIIGASMRVPLGGFMTDRVGIALAFYEPTDVVVRGRVLYPEKTQFPLLPDRAQSVTIRGALGVDVWHGLRAGIGFAALAEINGNVVAATDATGKVGTKVEDQLTATYAPVFGLTYELPLRADPGAIYRLGLAYRGTLDARFAVTIDGSKLSSLDIPLLNIAGTAQYDPAEIALEVARLDPRQVLALGVTFKRWSQFPGILEPTVVCSDGGPGACGLTPPSIDWRDTIGIHAGAERGVALLPTMTLRGRGGAFFETTPLPPTLPSSAAFDLPTKSERTLPTGYYDADRLGLTLGAGVTLAAPLPPIDVDLVGQYQILLPRTMRSTDPSGAVLEQGEASGHVTSFAMTAGIRF